MSNQQQVLAILQSHSAYKLPMTYKEFAEVLLLTLQRFPETMTTYIDLTLLKRQLRDCEQNKTITDREFLTPAAFDAWAQKYLSDWLTVQEMDQKRTYSYFSDNCDYIQSHPAYLGIIDTPFETFASTQPKNGYFFFHERDNNSGKIILRLAIWNSKNTYEKALLPIPADHSVLKDINKIIQPTLTPIISHRATLHQQDYYFHNIDEETALRFISATHTNASIRDPNQNHSAHYLVYSERGLYYFLAVHKNDKNEMVHQKFLMELKQYNPKHYIKVCQKEWGVNSFTPCLRANLAREIPLSLTPNEDPVIPNTSVVVAQNKFKRRLHIIKLNKLSELPTELDRQTFYFITDTIYFINKGERANCLLTPGLINNINSAQITDSKLLEQLEEHCQKTLKNYQSDDIDYNRLIGTLAEEPCQVILARRYEKTLQTLKGAVDANKKEINKGYLRPATFALAGQKGRPSSRQRFAKYPGLQDAILIDPVQFFQGVAYAFTGNAYTCYVTGKGASQQHHKQAATQNKADYASLDFNTNALNAPVKQDYVRTSNSHNSSTNSSDGLLVSSELEALSSSPEVSKAMHAPQTAAIKQLEIALRANQKIPDLNTNELLCLLLSKYFKNCTTLSLQEFYEFLCFNDIILTKQDYNFLPKEDPLFKKLPNDLVNFGRLPKYIIELVIRNIGRVQNNNASTFNPQHLIQILKSKISKNNQKGKNHPFRTTGFSARYSIAKPTGNYSDSRIYHNENILPHNEFVSANMDAAALDQCQCVMYPTDDKTTITAFENLPDPQAPRYIYGFSDPHFFLLESRFYIKAMKSIQDMFGVADPQNTASPGNLYPRINNPDGGVFSHKYCTVIRLKSKITHGNVAKPIQFHKDGPEGDAWNWLINTFFEKYQLAAYAQEAEHEGNFGDFYLPLDPITLQWRLLNHIAQYHPDYFAVLTLGFSPIIEETMDKTFVRYLLQLPDTHGYRVYMQKMYANKIEKLKQELDPILSILAKVNHPLAFYDYLVQQEQQFKQADEHQKNFQHIFLTSPRKEPIKIHCQQVLTTSAFAHAISKVFKQHPRYLLQILRGNLTQLPLSLRIFIILKVCNPIIQ